MRLRPRPLRSQTHLALVVIVFVIAALVWAVQEFLRLRPSKGEWVLAISSGMVFLSFFFGWMVR